jgi:RHS repeat-associated protein
MGVTSYYSFGGEILGEETGGVRRDYLTDALGSVTATVTGAGVVENTYRYKPYGSILAKTGTGSDPKFLWNGKWGYFKNGNTSSFTYVRARWYREMVSRWATKDKLGFVDGLNLYLYVGGNPISFYDRSGNQRNDNNGILKPSCNPDNKIGDVVRLVRGGRGGCGPDVTGSVERVLGQMRNDFHRLPRDKQIAKCAALVDSRTRSTAWDILPLNKYSGKNSACGQSSECEYGVTVSIGGSKTCECAGFVNYTAFGTMFGLCRDANICIGMPIRGKFCFSPFEMGWIIETWKLLGYQDVYGAGEETYWAGEGYFNNFGKPRPGQTKPGSKMCCTPCETKSDNFGYHWGTQDPPYENKLPFR